jgi:hypothetical protein
MPTIQECRKYAAEYKILGKDPQISGRRSTVLLSISRSWTALAHQLENLTTIAKEEEEVRPPTKAASFIECPAFRWPAALETASRAIPPSAERHRP